MFQDPGKSLNPFWTIGRHVEEIILTKENVTFKLPKILTS